MMNPKELPLPRLQLTWKQTDAREWNCSYDFLIPISGGDIRNDGPEGEVNGGPGFVAAHIGDTTCTRSRHPFDGSALDTPFRDGAHAMWDSARLGVPAFVVCDERAQFIEPKARS